MRRIDAIIVHCSATPPEMDIGVNEIRKWHIDRGWSDIGYHWVIRRSGGVERGRPEKYAGAHVKGHNKNTLGICLVGGRDRFNFTKAQMDSLVSLLKSLRVTYPDAAIRGHNDYTNKKLCPQFDVEEFFRGF